jgi:methionyl aminopeptidase
VINLYSQKEIEIISRVCRIVAETFTMIAEHIKEGNTTEKVDGIIEEYILSNDMKPAFKGYRGFPKASCISIDEEVVHGIPSGRCLAKGEIVSIDIGVEQQGYYGDAAYSFTVGEIDKKRKKLLETTQKALERGIGKARTGNRISDVSRAIQETCESQGFSVVRDLVGHGIGRELHEDPQIPNFVDPQRNNPRIQDGMVMAIEPMVNMGAYDVKTLEDGWTIVTEDGSPSAHFEHTVVIEKGKARILTLAN